MRDHRWPVWLLILAAFLIAVVIWRWFMPAALPDGPATPTPTFAIVVTVLPTVTASLSLLAPSRTPTSVPEVLLTRAPSLTPTATPTATAQPTDTPAPPTPTAAVQRG